MKGTAVNSKHCFYEFSSNIPECYNRLIEDVKDFPFYAYIFHHPDDDDSRTHVHFIIRTQPMTLKAISERLDLPPNFIRWVRVKRSFIRYLVHLDNPEKEQYNREDIITSDRVFVDNCFIDTISSSCSPLEEYSAFCDVINGNILPHDYINLHYSSIISLSFSSRLKVYSLLYSGSRAKFDKEVKL